MEQSELFRSKLRDAIALGREADAALAEAERAVGRAQGFGLADMLLPNHGILGALAGIGKHSNMREAQSSMDSAVRKLRAFESAAMQIKSDTRIEFGALFQVCDIFFDSFLIDAFAQIKMAKAARQIRETRSVVESALAKMQSMA